MKRVGVNGREHSLLSFNSSMFLLPSTLVRALASDKNTNRKDIYTASLLLRFPKCNTGALWDVVNFFEENSGIQHLSNTMGTTIVLEVGSSVLTVLYYFQ